MADIFISYAREDIAAAERLATALRKRWSVFWDRRIPAGRRFADVIAQELAAAKCVIALWSSAANASDWVLDEAEEARKRNILAPAFIEPVDPPMGFRRIHAADLIGWNGDPGHSGFQRLLEDIAHYVPESSRAEPRQQKADALAPEPQHHAPVSASPGDQLPAAGAQARLSSDATQPRSSAATPAGGAAASVAAPTVPAKPVSPATPRPWNRKWLWGAGAVTVIVLAASVWLISYNRPPTRPQPKRILSDAPASRAAAELPSRSSQPSSQTPNLSARSRKILESVSAALPEPAKRRRSAPWREAASNTLIQALDGIENSVTDALIDMDRNSDPYHKDFAKLTEALASPSIPVTARALSGSWSCGFIIVGKSGVLSYPPLLNCTIRDDGRCLKLAKTSGTSRINGCLYVLDDRNLAFVGKEWGIDHAGRRMGKDRETGGFLSAARVNRLRMIVPGIGNRGFDVLDLKRR